jgi:uncharacterized membrane protein YidH (DUF202 family)
MKDEQDYLKDIAEVRSMMERSSKFLSLSGLSGIMAGIYALIGASVAYKLYGSTLTDIDESSVTKTTVSPIVIVLLLAVLVLVLTLGTAIFLSYKKASKRGERLWNPTAKRMVINMAVPLIVGGLLILILISKGQIAMVAPFTLVFYGLALYTSSKFTYEEMRSLGLIQVTLGLISAYFVEYGLFFWALGFGVVHIIYGIYMHYRYER